MEPKDHDLLIAIDVKLERVIDDVRELKNNVASRVSLLEQEKFDKKDGDAISKLLEKYERRLRFVERAIWLGLGSLAALEIIFKYLK